MKPNEQMKLTRNKLNTLKENEIKDCNLVHEIC